jgi:predicted dehydrogenase
VIRLLLGKLTSGRALTASVLPEIGIPDTFSLQFTMQSGVNGMLNLYFQAKGLWENTLHILGEQGTITVGKDFFRIHRKDGTSIEEKDQEGMGYREEFEAFFRAIRENGPVLSSFKEAYRDLEILLKAIDAAPNGTVVQF